MKIFIAVFWLVFSINVQAFFWNDKTLTAETIDFWQPDTDETFQIPERPYNLYNYKRQLNFAGLVEFKRSFNTYNNKGTLFSSWNPAPKSSKPIPTVIVVHGGHGINPIEFQSAKWFKEHVGANVLIIDSFWSRGILENHHTTNQNGVNTMALDTIAAIRWLEKQPEVNTNFIYVYGGSQGGWVGLRLMTDDPFLNRVVNGKIKAAFSVYPFCREAPKYGGVSKMHVGTNLEAEPWFAPNLGPYNGRVFVFTGGRDDATNPTYCNKTVFSEATEWTHYNEGTHAWDLPTRGLGESAVDGDCAKAKNPLHRFQQCRNNSITNSVLEKIKSVIQNDLNS
jgi:dienelactone hydrolase